jgi:hypothetical protein
MQESIIFKYTPNNTPEVEESILSFKKQIKRIKFTVKENTIQKSKSMIKSSKTTQIRALLIINKLNKSY